MANPDHIDQLMKGVAAWNAWREEKPSISPDLSDASLSGRTSAMLSFSRQTPTRRSSPTQTSAASVSPV
jgi:hypothetical protein